jgi:hypothetical protein
VRFPRNFAEFVSRKSKGKRHINAPAAVSSKLKFSENIIILLRWSMIMNLLK